MAVLGASTAAEVTAALAKAGSTRLVVVCFSDSWSPTSRAVVSSLARLRQDLPFASLVWLEASREHASAQNLGIYATPAVVFYWNGHPVSLRRPDQDTDHKFVGALSDAQLLQTIHHVQDCCLQGEQEQPPLVSLDF